MATSQPCPICGSDREVAALIEKDGWPLLRCGSCDHLFVHPRPTDEELSLLYSFESGYQASAGARVRAGGAAIPEKFRVRVRQIARHRPAGALLDVGCSFGGFLSVAREQGFDTHGVEVNPDTAAIAQEAGLCVRTGTLDQARFPDERFDVVHLGDVIEHVPAPEELLAEVRRVLRRDGLLVIATPNHAALFPRAGLLLQRALGVPWSHATPPHHLHQFSTRSLERLLQRVGFDPLEACYAPSELGYELRATAAPSRLKRALAARDAPAAARAGLASVAVALLYPPLWGLARVLSAGRPDADMTVFAIRAT